MKENSFTLVKARSKRYPAQTITDVDYADDITLLANTSVFAESLLRNQEWPAGGIGLHVNADKTVLISFNQRGDISLNGKSLKLMDMFTYFRSSVSSTEIDINAWLVKSSITIDRLSVIWKSDLSVFFLSSSRVSTVVWMHHTNVD